MSEKVSEEVVEKPEVKEEEMEETTISDFIPEDVTVRIERVYVVPLWRSWGRKRGIRRAKKAVAYLKRFMIRHMKGIDVKISPEVNRLIWKNGIRNPPRRITVRAVLGSDDIVYVTLPKDVK